MRDHEPHTWNNEPWVLARFVEAVDSNDTDAQAEFGQRLLDGTTEDGWGGLQPVDEGTYIPFGAFDVSRVSGGDAPYLVDLGADTPPRKSATASGLPLTDVEVAQWRDAILERALHPECGHAWVIFKAQSHSRLFVAATTEPSPAPHTAPSLRFVASATTHAEVLAALKHSGLVERRDYEARAADVLRIGVS